MLHTRNIPISSNTAKSEFTVDFTKLDKGFSILQNVKPSLKVTDGNNSQLDSVVLTKRDGSSVIVDSGLDKVTSQLYFNDINGDSSHILTDGTSFKDIQGNSLNIPITPSGEGAINSISVHSYIGDVLYAGKNYNGIHGTWDSVEYDYNTDLSKLTYNNGNWDEDELIGMNVTPNTNNDSVFFKVEENGSNWLKVRGDIVGVQSTTTADITTTSTEIPLNSTVGFPTGGGSLRIGDSDEIYFTVIDGNKLSDVTGISINYASGTVVSNGMSKVAAGNEFQIQYVAITDKILDIHKTYNAGGGGELTGYIVKITEGTGAGQVRKIVSNTKHVINTDIAFNPVLDSSSTYHIYKENGQVMYASNGDNNLLRFDGSNFDQIDAPSGKYIESFDGRSFIGNTTIVAPDEISLKVTAFVASGASSIFVTNTDGLSTSGGLLQISKSDGTTYDITYGGINDNELTDVSGLVDNLEKFDIIKYVSRRRKGTATSGTTTSITDTNRVFKDDVFKDMYLIITNGTNAGTKSKIISNTSDTVTIEGPVDVAFDDTSEYQIHTINKFNIYYSNVNDFEDFNLALRFITPPGNDEITGLKTWNDKLIIFKRRSIRSCTFVFNSRLGIFTPKITKISSDTGCINGRSIVEVSDSLWFFDGREYKSVGYSETQIGVIKTDSVSFQINKLFKSLNITQEDDIASIYNDKKFYFAPKGLDVFVFDYEYNTWITYTGLDINSFITDDNHILYFGGRNNGNVSRFDSNIVSDNHSPIYSIIETKAIDLGNDHLYKRFRHAAFAFENSVCTMDLKLIINSASQLKIVDDVTKLGTPAFGGLSTESMGLSHLGEGLDLSLNQNLISTIKKAINKKGITLKMRISNDRDENFSLSGMSFTYSIMKEKYFPNRFIR